MKVWISTAMVIMLASPAGAQWNDDADKCTREMADLDLKIQYCSRAIQSSELSQGNLANIYNTRGSAYGRNGQYDQAIRDFNQSIRLNPDDPLAFTNRGIAYTLLNEATRAIQDYDQASRLDSSKFKPFVYRGIDQ